MGASLSSFLASKGARGKNTLVILLVLGLFAAVPVPEASAQPDRRPLFDGLTVGAGLSVYIGDLDGNPDGNPIQYFAAGQLRLMVAADRRFGAVTGGLELHYDRIDIDRGGFVLSNNIISFDIVGGYHIDIFRDDLFRLSGGIGVSLLIPSYDQLPGDLDGIDALGTRPILTVPLTLSIQDRVFLGLRLTGTDFLDGFEGSGGGSIDLLSFVSVGYRFDLLN